MRRSSRALMSGFVLLCLVVLPVSSRAEDPSVEELVTAVRPLLTALTGKAQQFEVSGSATFQVDNKPQTVDGRLVRYNDESFDLVLTHADYAVEIRRRFDVTALALPRHNVVFVGTGLLKTPDRLTCTGTWSRLASPASEASALAFVFSFMAFSDPDGFARSVLAQSDFEYNADTRVWKTGSSTLATDRPGSFLMHTDDVDATLQTQLTAPESPAAAEWEGYTRVDIPREELEKTLVRGVRRATEILRPNDTLLRPKHEDRTTDNGRLQWIDGQRVAVLWGSPEQIGTAHGTLLQDEARRCVESVMYTFGIASTIRTGRWFRHDLEAAYARLEPHIPERHKRETRAMAVALNMDPHEAEMLNVFPELFHCSGFAVFGSATAGGTLYHGRVLDYMTTIGLQDSATIFIIQPEDHFAFANVGYGGFTGSVTGMNAEGISLGEMGGRGEGNWDGVPMATLMRRALEECDTLEEVKTLWQTSPRTCEYYYVFADGKTSQAVGVAATPEKLEFVEPGAAHELLGDGIPDAVVLSAGSRLEELRRRVKEKHGSITIDDAIALMSRPVAMQSNLHNALFIPQQGILYVANAGHDKPAAEMPYVRLDLNALLRTASAATLTAAGSQ